MRNVLFVECNVVRRNLSLQKLLSGFSPGSGNLRPRPDHCLKIIRCVPCWAGIPHFYNGTLILIAATSIKKSTGEVFDGMFDRSLSLPAI